MKTPYAVIDITLSLGRLCALTVSFGAFDVPTLLVLLGCGRSRGWSAFVRFDSYGGDLRFLWTFGKYSRNTRAWPFLSRHWNAYTRRLQAEQAAGLVTTELTPHTVEDMRQEAIALLAANANRAQEQRTSTDQVAASLDASTNQVLEDHPGLAVTTNDVLLQPQIKPQSSPRHTSIMETIAQFKKGPAPDPDLYDLQPFSTNFTFPEPTLMSYHGKHLVTFCGCALCAIQNGATMIDVVRIKGTQTSQRTGTLAPVQRGLTAAVEIGRYRKGAPVAADEYESAYFWLDRGNTETRPHIVQHDGTVFQIETHVDDARRGMLLQVVPDGNTTLPTLSYRGCGDLRPLRLGTKLRAGDVIYFAPGDNDFRGGVKLFW